MIFRLFTLILFVAAFTSGCFSLSEIDGPDPNILLIVMDAARADHFSCYDYHRRTTPNIDRVAAEGLRFTQAVSSSSWTLPSHASLFTGLLLCEHKAHAQHTWLIDRIPTLAELLKEHGYRTAGFSDNPLIDPSTNMARGFDTFVAAWSDSGETDYHKTKHTEKINSLVRRFIEENNPGEAPFYVFINYMDVHTPYDPPEPYRSLFLGKDRVVSSKIDSVNYDPQLVNKEIVSLSETDYEVLRSLYDGAYVYLDTKIAELLDYLRSRGLYENTLVIITSDHGEVFGEYGLFTHTEFLYRPLVHIPLIIRHPLLTGSAGVRHAPVSITDIFYTIVRHLEIEDLAAPGGAPASNLLDPGLEQKACYSEVKVSRTGSRLLVPRIHDARSLWTAEGRHYIVGGREAAECYDLSADFDEERNLCPDQVSAEQVVSELTGYESRLKVLVETPQDLRITRDIRVDPQQERAMRALGYVGDDAIPQSNTEHPHVIEHVKEGIFFMKLDSLEAAEREIKMALQMSPNGFTVLKYLAKILSERGKYKDAIRVLRSIIARGGRDEVGLRLLLAETMAKTRQMDGALEQLRIIIEIDPSIAEVSVNAANLLMQKGEFQSAESYLKKLLFHHPDDLEVIRKVIGLYFNYRKWQPARSLLLKEIEKAPSPRAYHMLGQACLNMGRRGEARRYFQMLLTMNISPQIREQVEKQLKKL